MSQPPLVEAKQLVRRFGAITALAKVDLTVSAGELVLILGPNGAGKTTLLRALAGLVRPNRGTVRLAGEEPNKNPEARAVLGFVSHNALLYEDLTPRENLRFTAALHQLDGAERRIEHALARANLTHRADSPVRGFSRGMLQRLSLARATLHDPTLLLLDEPFTGLDLPASDLLREDVGQHLGRGDAVIAVTHEPADLWSIATRVIVMRAGKIVYDSPKQGDLGEFRQTLSRLMAA